MPENSRDWRSRAKDAKITGLTTFPAATEKPAFVRHRFEAGRLREQGLRATGGNHGQRQRWQRIFVTITLSANSREAERAAEPAIWRS